MEYIVALLVIIVIYLISQLRSSFESKLDFLQNEVIKLREALKATEQKRDWDAKMQKQAAEVSKSAQV
ncbi:MAG TPA: hypothetical protein VF602_04865, partial [Pedobacter sp.]